MFANLCLGRSRRHVSRREPDSLCLMSAQSSGHLDEALGPLLSPCGEASSCLLSPLRVAPGRAVRARLLPSPFPCPCLSSSGIDRCRKTDAVVACQLASGVRRAPHSRRCPQPSPDPASARPYAKGAVEPQQGRRGVLPRALTGSSSRGRPCVWSCGHDRSALV